MTSYEGTFQADGLRFAVVASRFNDLVTRRLLDGALDAFRRHGLGDDAVDVAWVPGAAEIPVAAKHLAESGRYAAIATVGAVIRGATGHYDAVVSMVAGGVARVALDSGIPVLFGVLTTDTLDQALERSGGKAGNKGSEVAAAALEMADLLRRLGG